MSWRTLLVLSFAVLGAYGSPARFPTPSSELVHRIVGGEDAGENEFPHQISLQYFGNHRCGGSIIHESYIATAAHCVYGTSADGFTVVYGTNDQTSSGTEVAVSSFTYHENYVSVVPPKYDVAILELEEPIPLDGTTTKRIRISQESFPQNTNCVLSGWGTTSPGGSIPQMLQKVDLTVITDAECRAEWGSNFDPDHQICTFKEGSAEGSPCNGDSGGPLICPGNDEWEEVGIVSWGESQCSAGSNDFPAAYARASVYRDWFNENCDGCLDN